MKLHLKEKNNIDIKQTNEMHKEMRQREQKGQVKSKYSNDSEDWKEGVAKKKESTSEKEQCRLQTNQ